MKMTLAEKRRCALAVLNYNNRHSSHGFVEWRDAMLVLDDFARSHPNTVAANFWMTSSDHQLNLLRREYNRTKPK